MPDTIFRLSASPLSATFRFTTPQNLLQEFSRHMYVNLGNTSQLFTIGSTEPAADKRTTPWLQIDGSGKPVAWNWFYNGSWRQVPTFRPGMIVDYSGSIALFDSTGKGKENTDMDGWALCNGQNGTLDLRNTFIVGGEDYTSSRWRTTITGDPVVAGGQANHLIAREELFPFKDTINGEKHPEIELALNDTAFIANSKGTTSITGQTPLPLPPFVALAKITWIGY